MVLREVLNLLGRILNPERDAFTIHIPILVLYILDARNNVGWKAISR
jgi:hypothetical protein